MEKQLPARIYGEEWSRLRINPGRSAVVRSWFEQYRELSYIERLIPVVFAVIYLVALIR
jgi:hypothetical protein